MNKPILPIPAEHRQPANHNPNGLPPEYGPDPEDEFDDTRDEREERAEAEADRRADNRMGDHERGDE